MLGRCGRRVVDQIVGALAAAAVIEELDAHVPVDGEDPVARLVHFADERAAVATQYEADDGPGRGIGHRSGDGRGRRRNPRGKLAEQQRSLLGALDDGRRTVPRLTAPTGAAVVVVVVPNREGLDETVKRDRVLGPKWPVRRHLFGRKHIEEETDVRPVTRRVTSEVGRLEHRHRELREDVALRGNGKRFPGGRTVARQERRDRLSHAGSVPHRARTDARRTGGP